METNVLVALIVVVLLVVGINGALFLLMRKGKPNQHIRMWQAAASRARKPWEEEDRQLEELSSLVKQLKADPRENEET